MNSRDSPISVARQEIGVGILASVRLRETHVTLSLYIVQRTSYNSRAEAARRKSDCSSRLRANFLVLFIALLNSAVRRSSGKVGVHGVHIVSLKRRVICRIQCSFIHHLGICSLYDDLTRKRIIPSRARSLEYSPANAPRKNITIVYSLSR